MSDERKDLVRRGYDRLSVRYEQVYRRDTDESWLAELVDRVPAGGSVLDIGCGAGIPVAAALATAGLRVTGVDISEVQVARARERVLGGRFVRADATELRFAEASFDAIVSLYMLIHVPLVEQRPLIERIAGWLRPGGVLLVITGHTAWTGTEDDWLGGGVPMWWSHTDAATYRDWLSGSGLVIEREEFVPEGDGGHALFLASRSSG